ncbi:DUF2085 domain-containing protein [Methanobacterium alkalithermotolerans]|uniref:DUF2085 domain-containing protein n=1 Tax=Methanobacterium alkalithermotolerans TaxID=2731220 RepID=A0A8T8K3Q7_9EURY|nr:DUF2085 domain-containing protein [Methanobacterium alkalithermotolerans]QUH23138.1 DUF2085 domain-containing protein [Methanobacterium alkalithermotolerans]
MDLLTDPQYPKFLPLCHQKEDRSIYFKNKPLPLCARCTGIFLGIFTLPFFHIGLIDPSILALLFLTAPAIIDGGTQYLEWRESNNLLRLVTGFMLGSSLAILVVITGRIIVYSL